MILQLIERKRKRKQFIQSFLKSHQIKSKHFKISNPSPSNSGIEQFSHASKSKFKSLYQVYKSKKKQTKRYSKQVFQTLPDQDFLQLIFHKTKPNNLFLSSQSANSKFQTIYQPINSEKKQFQSDQLQEKLSTLDVKNRLRLRSQQLSEKRKNLFRLRIKQNFKSKHRLSTKVDICPWQQY